MRTLYSGLASSLRTTRNNNILRIGSSSRWVIRTLSQYADPPVLSSAEIRILGPMSPRLLMILWKRHYSASLTRPSRLCHLLHVHILHPDLVCHIPPMWLNASNLTGEKQGMGEVPGRSNAQESGRHLLSPRLALEMYSIST